MLVTPNLHLLTIIGGGLHMLDGSRRRLPLSILCHSSSLMWIGTKPNVEISRENV